MYYFAYLEKFFLIYYFDFDCYGFLTYVFYFAFFLFWKEF